MIDTTTFQYANSRWEDISEHIRNKGYDVYSPGTKVGECTKPYIVVKNDGSSQHTSFSTDNDLYAVMCYVPKMQYSRLEPLVQEIKDIMEELKPMILPYGTQTPSYYDDSVKAHMVSIEYKNYKKL